MATLLFTPTLIVQTTRYELPRPIVALRLADSWDYARFKVPLLDGDVTVGRSQSGVDVHLEGQIGTQAGLLKGSETQMFQTLEQLRSFASSTADNDLTLILYRDRDTDEEHHLKKCSLVRFEYDLSDTHLFTYAAVLHASDPAIHIAPPL